MGVKAVKQHYNIRHIVHIKEGKLCIGSGFINDMLIFSPTGKLLREFDHNSDAELTRYTRDITADPVLFTTLLQQEDQHDSLISAYTYTDDAIIEVQCVQVGWPNTTVDGLLMYDNTYFENKLDAVKKAKASYLYGLQSYESTKADLENRLATVTRQLSELKASKQRLDAEYPDVIVSID
ncbi:hypothetical protein ACKF11_13290 [Methylobacillus sp. Pita2]|uniref:hypothetical protein n=1 Tax=Methylobacillus sp. Pita2 TaxID=3383245 RepID=UPI0038B63967